MSIRKVKVKSIWEKGCEKLNKENIKKYRFHLILDEIRKVLFFCHKKWTEWYERRSLKKIIIFSILIYLSFCIVNYLNREIIRIGYGPYFTYTPIDLKSVNQKKYNKVNWDLYHFLWPFTKSYVFQVQVCERVDYEDIIRGSIDYYKNGKEDKNQMTSVNSYMWLYASLNTDSVTKLDTSQLHIIGYKKWEKDYYNSRFVWHKHIGDLKSRDCQTIQRILDSIPDVRILFNSKEKSGSTYIIPKIYLIENYPDNDSLNIGYITKSNAIDEVVSKRQAIGIISNSEFTEQLDASMRDSLFIQDIMINMPHDPIVVNKKWWKKQGINNQRKILCALIEHNVIIPSTYSLDSVLKDSGHFLWKWEFKQKNDIEYFKREIEKREILEGLLKYYVSMGILTKDTIYIPDNNFLGLNFLDSDSCAVFETIYGGVKNQYFTFRKIEYLDSVTTDSIMIYAKTHDFRRLRVVPINYKKQTLDSLNCLIKRRDSTFHDYNVKK